MCVKLLNLLVAEILLMVTALQPSKSYISILRWTAGHWWAWSVYSIPQFSIPCCPLWGGRRWLGRRRLGRRGLGRRGFGRGWLGRRWLGSASNKQCASLSGGSQKKDHGDDPDDVDDAT